MGQYYKACFVNTKKDKVEEYFESWDTNSGSKLMEHSYVGNKFVMNVTYKMINSPKRLVWAGDYGDEIVGEDNFYDLTNNAEKSEPFEIDMMKHVLDANTIYINHDKKEWFDLKKQTIPAMRGWSGIVHPLPILTADGNGRGGGDYGGANMELVGTWKGDLIEISDTIPDNYIEIEPWFTEMSQKEIDEYFKELENPKKKYTIKINYTTSEEFVVEAHTEEEALTLVEDMNPDETQVYENLTLDGSPHVIFCED